MSPSCRRWAVGEPSSLASASCRVGSELVGGGRERGVSSEQRSKGRSPHGVPGWLLVRDPHWTSQAKRRGHGARPKPLRDCPATHLLEAQGGGSDRSDAAAQQLDQRLGLEALGQDGACRDDGVGRGGAMPWGPECCRRAGCNAQSIPHPRSRTAQRDPDKRDSQAFFCALALMLSPPKKKLPTAVGSMKHVAAAPTWAAARSA